MSEEDFLESLSKYPNFELITNLDISDKKLRKIKNLPKKLKVLNCSNNFLTTLDFKNYEAYETIEEINCSKNQLIYLKNLPKNLKKLICSDNKIEQLDLPKSIEIVNCDNNKIGGKIIFMPKMSYLSANNNLITEIENSKIPYNLKNIYLNDNLIEHYPRARFHLINVEIKNNPIKYYTISKLGLFT
jgi:Leucine-rich repeat (LRR) protein